MKLCKKKSPNNLPEFSGRVKIVISGLDQRSRFMSIKCGGVPAKALTLGDTTVQEVYDVVFRALKRAVEE